MISLSKYSAIKEKYGHCGSWAVWAPERDRPKDNIGDLSVLDPTYNPDVLTIVNPHIVLVGLNISRPIAIPLANFHDAKPQAMDFKLRFALKDSPYWGAYMTDVIKDYEQKSAGKMMAYLRHNKDFEKDNIRAFRQELSEVGSQQSTIVAIGKDAYKVLKRNLENQLDVIPIPHYSAYASKETYREQVKQALGF